MELEINREKPNILITGTPGVGKTTLSKLLKEYIDGLELINLGEVINQNKLYNVWNEEFNVPEFDEDMVVDFLEEKMCKGGVILDFHSSGFFPERWFDLVVLLRANNTFLFDRLKERGYPQKKITENIECEILEVTKEEVESCYKQEIILELVNELPNQIEQNIMLIIDFLSKWQATKKKSADQQQFQQG